MGDDWKGKFDFLNEYCQVVYLPRTEGISTSKIKEDLKAIKKDVDRLSKKLEEDINREY